MRATPGKWAEYSAREKEIMAENSAIMAEYSAREKEKLWLRIQQLWPSIRQKKKNCGRVFGKRKRIVAEYSAKYGRGFGKRKEIWLRFQQVQGVANLISKHERERKMKEIGVTWYV